MPIDSQQNTIESLRSRLSKSLLIGDRPSAQSIVDESVRLNLSTANIYNQIIGPTLTHIGELWHEGSISIAHEHLSTQILQEFIETIYQSTAKMTDIGAKIIVTSPEGERHWIGSKMFANLLAIEGWDVHFLGPETPLDDLVSYAKEVRPNVIALNAVFENSITKLEKYINGLNSLATPPLIIIGGPSYITQNINFSGVLLVNDLVDGISQLESKLGMGSGAISLNQMLLSIGNNVLNIRRARGLNQGSLADLAGVDRAYISLVENGKQNLTMAALIKIADALNVPVINLLVNTANVTNV